MPRVSIAKPDQRSPAAVAYRKLYFTKEWRALRAAQLQREPLCIRCLMLGRRTQATVVDHHIPHRGNLRLFTDPKNHRSMCAPHHREKTNVVDGGFGRPRRNPDDWPIRGCDANGTPLDPLHPWARKA